MKLIRYTCPATYMLGKLAGSDPDALKILETQVSQDQNGLLDFRDTQDTPIMVHLLKYMY